MIVALGIFTVVALVAIGALVRITDANRKSITLKTTINNLNFALESLSREMRVGGGYHCETGVARTISSSVAQASCSISNPASGWTIAFKSSKKSGPPTDQCFLIYAYRYNADPSEQTIQKAEQTACHQDIVDADFDDLISKDIKITDTIVNVNIDSGNQPKAFFWFKGYSGIRQKERTEFEVQTTVSQRVGAN